MAKICYLERQKIKKENALLVFESAGSAGEVHVSVTVRCIASPAMDVKVHVERPEWREYLYY